MLGNPKVGAVAARAGKSPAQVALRWAAQRGLSVVTRATDPAYLREDLDIFAWNLTGSDMASLDAVSSPICEPYYAPFGCCGGNSTALA